MIFKKNKPINVTLITSSQQVFDTSKPDKALKFIPSWFEHFNHSYKIGDGVYPTIKGCRGLIDLYKRGLMIPAWCDMNVNIGELGNDAHSWQFADFKTEAEPHSYEQFPNEVGIKSLAHLKVISPWRMICDEEIYWSWQEPVWNDFKNFSYRIIPGVSEYKYQHNLNINFMFKRQLKSYECFIKNNFPLVHITPLSDRQNLKINYECVSEEDFKKTETPKVGFINNYLKAVKLIKRK